jgi:hypothetical protein
MKKAALGAMATALLAGACDSSVKMTGATPDGETFTGTATATGAWDTSGPIHLISNRGLTCLGSFVFEGIMGPAGKMSFTCNNGETGQATMYGVLSGTGEGTIGNRPITLRWGSAKS